MAKYTGPKCRLCRRQGEKLFLKGERCNSVKCALVKRNFPPGQHAQKGYPRLTEYGLQLKEKQKAKKTYGILERQFRNYYQKASQKQENTTAVFLQLLEMRLDNIVYRAGLAASRTEARKMVNHGHFLVQGKKVDIPSCQIKVGQEIRVKPNSLTKKYFQELLKVIEKRETVAWLKVDKKNLVCQVVGKPTLENTQTNFALNMIIEFYSR